MHKVHEDTLQGKGKAINAFVLIIKKTMKSPAGFWRQAALKRRPNGG
jgi:hypothetical protein